MLLMFLIDQQRGSVERVNYSQIANTQAFHQRWKSGFHELLINDSDHYETGLLSLPTMGTGDQEEPAGPLISSSPMNQCSTHITEPKCMKGFKGQSLGIT